MEISIGLNYEMPAIVLMHCNKSGLFFSSDIVATLLQFIICGM